jgi:predicted nucleotidyltransferase
MLATLFSSRVRAKILADLFLFPGIERNAWELSLLLKETYSAVWRELNRLEDLGILVSEPKGNSKAYRVNQTSPIEPELRSIVLKTEGLGGLLQKKLGEIGNIHKAFIFGSVASGKADSHSDVDLMVIGNVELERFSSLIAESEKDLNRPINYVIFTKKEWEEKLAKGEAFALNVEGSEKIMLVGG